MATAEAIDLPDDLSVLEQSSPESLRRHRTLSPHPTEQNELERYTSNSEDQLTELAEEDYHDQCFDTIRRSPKKCSSTRSSISSFPGSVIHTIPLTDTEDDIRLAIRRLPAHQKPISPSPKARGLNQYASPFRNPSSVLAMRMQETDYSDSDALSTTPSYQRRSPRVSHYSPHRYGHSRSGSVQSSPTKRSSRPGTPSQLGSQHGSHLKHEFPLVLLHCTILASSTGSRNTTVPDDIYEAVLPDPYNKRWRALQDKVHANSQVKQRGVLISHPREEYELLEENLLESLELERPRITQDHYLNEDEPDSGFESAGSQTGSDKNESKSSANDSCSHECPDCGTKISLDPNYERKYEVRVFAANGLMREGAWAAAWSEMEKVDVEVNIWMPEQVRREVEARLTAIAMKEEENKIEPRPEEATPRGKKKKVSRSQARRDARMKEIYGEDNDVLERSRTQAEIDGLEEELDRIETKKEPTEIDTTKHRVSFDENVTTRELPPIDASPLEEQPPFSRPYQTQQIPSQQKSLSALALRRLQLAFADQRNIAIVVLSIIVLFFSITQSKAVHTNMTHIAEPRTFQPKSEVTTSLLSVSSGPVVEQLVEPEIRVEYVTMTVTSTDITPAASSTDVVQPAGALSAADSPEIIEQHMSERTEPERSSDEQDALDQPEERAVDAEEEPSPEAMNDPTQVEEFVAAEINTASDFSTLGRAAHMVNEEISNKDDANLPEQPQFDDELGVDDAELATKFETWDTEEALAFPDKEPTAVDADSAGEAGWDIEL